MMPDHSPFDRVSYVLKTRQEQDSTWNRRKNGTRDENLFEYTTFLTEFACFVSPILSHVPQKIPGQSRLTHLDVRTTCEHGNSCQDILASLSRNPHDQATQVFTREALDRTRTSRIACPFVISRCWNTGASIGRPLTLCTSHVRHIVALKNFYPKLLD